ncbi:MAG: pyruvate:ferredoxin (flavodoxin) oxidoreductase [Eubacteriales bacterium]|nr:pyruvate:ferredoxin (flavodoxin) oxidoreductase [Clostridiales bacterium]MDY5835625.1 pyruvate:ferredoxin (flavodoxin) oxidoreductase [Eubacteriales bacterium]
MSKEKKFMMMDGNTAAAWTAYAFTEVAGIYPITPSSPMADMVDQWAVQGRKNIFGQTVNVVEMQSEAGAAGVVHGSLGTGALTTTFTASQGLLLKIPNMYKIAGEFLPGVFHVAARTIATHALSIFGDHSDVMSARQTGFALLASNSVQEAHDMAAVAHLSAIEGRVPFLHFFDGFRTSHEISKVQLLDYDDLKELVDMDAVEAFRKHALSPNQPILRGSAENPDVFFQAREAGNPFYLALPAVIEKNLKAINKLTGKNYQFFDYYGAEDADKLIILMGSAVETAAEVALHLNKQGEKCGVINVRVYRPFCNDRLLAAIPKTVKHIAVLDRCKEPGAAGEPLYLDVVNAFKDVENAPRIIRGRYGLSSKNTTPDQFVSVFKELDKAEPKKEFTIGINDDVTHLSLEKSPALDIAPEGTIACRFWGLGSDGTVGANKNSIKIIGDHTDLYAQAYFSYDSKKSGGVTISDLRFGKHPINAPYTIDVADFVACHNQSYVDKYDMLAPLKKGGSFLLNTHWNAAELDEHLPGHMKRFLAENDIKLYTINAVDIAAEIGLGSRINTICQAAFFAITKVIPVEDAVKYMKEAIVKSYGHKGEEIVKMNYAAVDAGIEKFQEVPVPVEWKNAQDAPKAVNEAPDFIQNVVEVMNAQKGDSLPVSTFVDREDGHWPAGTTQYEKRGIAVNVPIWNSEKCIQCNQCSFVCPHAVIRPYLFDEEEAKNAPESLHLKDGNKPYEQYKYAIQISPLDCTGCGSCANICPAKALDMEPREDHLDQEDNYKYASKISKKANPMNTASVKGSQFEEPHFCFSGACAGCGETPYVKLVTQLFGDRMQISNATGCSSIYGGSAPSTPYCPNAAGHGPAWANSLFEDAAEHGLGMHLGYKQLRNRAKGYLTDLLGQSKDVELMTAIQAWLDGFEDGENTRALTDTMVEKLKAYKGEGADLAKQALEYEDYLVKRSSWIIGGDGWAYDIGYGGLDHVMASGEDINILVLDTEVYSNTGGQASKSTPLGAIAEFAAGGKPVKKKDLGAMVMTYGYVYVAQISMGANQAQTLRAIREAEAWHGPSIVIAYAPCINHGIRGGLTISQTREKDAVETGYWHLYRYNPALKNEGKNPFILDSKEPKRDYKEFLQKEVRYTSLAGRYSEEEVDSIFERAAEAAEERYQNYIRMASYEPEAKTEG